jgi:hypothetical protein
MASTIVRVVPLTSLTWILRRYTIIKLGSSSILLVQDRIHQWYSLSQHLFHSPTKVQEVI